MSRNKEIKNKGSVAIKSSVAYTVCSIIQKCLGFLTLPLFTRLLTLEQYGQFSVYFSWSSIITIFTTLNLPYGSFSKAMIKFNDNRAQYVATIQIICLVLTAVLIAIYLPLRNYFNQLFELPTLLVLIMFVEILTNIATQSWLGRMRFEYKYKGVIILTLCSAVLSPIIGVIAVLISTEKGYARIIGYAIVTITIGLGFWIYNSIKGKYPFRKDMLKYALGMNVPLIAYYVSQVIFNQSDRIMISHLVGMDKAAMYSVAYSIAIVLTFVIDAINNSYIPWLYGKIKDGQEYENKKVSVMIASLIAFLLLAIIALAPELIYVLGGAQYVDAKWVVVPVAMSLLLLFYSQLSINIEFYYEKKYLLIIASLVSAGVNIGLNFWLIPIYGYVAAGYTTLLSYFIFAVGNYIVVIVLLKIRKQKNTMFNVPALLLVLAVFMGIGFLAMYLYNYSIIRYSIIGVVLLTILISMKWIVKYVKRYFNIGKIAANNEEDAADSLIDKVDRKDICHDSVIDGDNIMNNESDGKEMSDEATKTANT